MEIILNNHGRHNLIIWILTSKTKNKQKKRSLAGGRMDETQRERFEASTTHICLLMAFSIFSKILQCVSLILVFFLKWKWFHREENTLFTTLWSVMLAKFSYSIDVKICLRNVLPSLLQRGRMFMCTLSCFCNGLFLNIISE